MVALWALIAPTAYAADRFVATGGDDAGNDCASPQTPCRSIARALVSAASGDVIKIERGSYTESLSITTSTELSLQGGWTAGFAARDPAHNKTRLRPVRSDFGGTDSVFYLNAVATQTIAVTLDGLNLLAARDDSPVSAFASGGGAVSLSIANSSIRATRLHDEFFGALGGGISAIAQDGSSIDLAVVDSSVRANRAIEGGGLYLRAQSGGSIDATLTRALVQGNKAEVNRGGGIFASAESGSTIAVAIADSSIVRNRANLLENGGGIYAEGDPSSSVTVDVSDSHIDHNATRFGVGGGIHASGATVSLARSTLSQNGARGAHVKGTLTVTDSFVTRNTSGGLSVEGDLNLVNSVVSANRPGPSWPDGGGIHLDQGTLTALNATITANRVAARGGGVFLGAAATASFTNTILWGNHLDGPAGGKDLYVEGTAAASYCDIDDVSASGTYTDGGGNIDSDPQLTAPPADHHLRAGSPAIDAGTCSGAPADDFDGNPRPAGATCDIGADEFAP